MLVTVGAWKIKRVYVASDSKDGRNIVSVRVIFQVACSDFLPGEEYSILGEEQKDIIFTSH